MPSIHFQPKLNKKHFLSHLECKVCSINGYAVRNATQADEEFGNFGTTDEVPNLIPKGEVWISEKLAPKDILHCQCADPALCAGPGHVDRAYAEGIEAERHLREMLNGIAFRDGKPRARVPEAIYLEPYLTLSDPERPVHVWIVDGNLVRSYYKTDYTEGGHGFVYPWVPHAEIWVEDGVDRREVPLILCHEYLERRLMRDEKLEYDKAHVICAQVEFDLRKKRGATPLLVRGRKKLSKRICPT